MVGVDENSRVLPSMVKAYGQTFVPELKKVAESVHSYGAKLIVQISHCGQKANQIDNGGSPLGPSDSETAQGNPVKAISRDGIRSVIASFRITSYNVCYTKLLRCG